MSRSVLYFLALSCMVTVITHYGVSVAIAQCDPACHGANCFENTPGQYRAIRGEGSLGCKRGWYDGDNGYQESGPRNLSYEWDGMNNGGGGCAPTSGTTSASGCYGSNGTSGSISCCAGCIRKW